MSVLPRIALFFMFSHGIHGIHRTFLLLFSHGLHSSLCSPTDFTDLHRCCFQGGALVSSAPTRSVVALLALLVHLRQVYPLERTYLCRSEICGRILSATSSVDSVNSVGEYLGRVISVGVLPVNLLLAMLAQIGVALREVVVAEPPATVGRQR